MTGYIISNGFLQPAKILKQSEYSRILKWKDQYFVRWRTPYGENQEECESLEDSEDVFDDYVNGESCFATGAKPTVYGTFEKDEVPSIEDLIWALGFFHQYSPDVAEELIEKHIGIFELNRYCETVEFIALNIIEAEKKNV